MQFSYAQRFATGCGVRCAKIDFRLKKFVVIKLNSGPHRRGWMIYACPHHHHLHHHRHLRLSHLRLSHATMRIHFSLIAGISGNKGNERAASYGLIHQELIEASLVSSADRAGVELECAVLYVHVHVTLQHVCESPLSHTKMSHKSVIILRNGIFCVCVFLSTCSHARLICLRACWLLLHCLFLMKDAAIIVDCFFGQKVFSLLRIPLHTDSFSLCVGRAVGFGWQWVDIEWASKWEREREREKLNRGRI